MSNKTLFTITSSRSKVFVTFSYSLFPKCVRTSIFRCRTWTQSSLSAATSLPTCSPMRTTSTSWVTHCFRPLQTINLSHFQIAGKLVFIFPSKQQKKNLDLYVVLFCYHAILFLILARGASLADFIQPSLGPLQPNLDDFMDTLEPLQGIICSDNNV